MRLTNLHREAFVRAVLADVPFIDYDEQIRKIVCEDAIEALPAAVQKVARDATLKAYLNTTYFYRSGRHMPSVSVIGRDRDGYSMSSTAEGKVNTLLELKSEQATVRNDLETKLKAAIGACATRRAAVESLPEFEKYLPVDPGGRPKSEYLPAIANLVTDLAAAGWPKGKQATAVA